MCILSVTCSYYPKYIGKILGPLWRVPASAKLADLLPTEQELWVDIVNGGKPPLLLATAFPLEMS